MSGYTVKDDDLGMTIDVMVEKLVSIKSVHGNIPIIIVDGEYSGIEVKTVKGIVDNDGHYVEDTTSTNFICIIEK